MKFFVCRVSRITFKKSCVTPSFGKRGEVTLYFARSALYVRRLCAKRSLRSLGYRIVFSMYRPFVSALVELQMLTIVFCLLCCY